MIGVSQFVACGTPIFYGGLQWNIKLVRIYEGGCYMVCKGCGKEIEDGQEYCGACSLSAEDNVIRVTKDDIKKLKKKAPRLKSEGPFINVEGYVKSLTSDITNMMALIGAVLLYLSPFFSWLRRGEGSERVKGSLFDVGGKNAVLSVHHAGLLIAAVLLLLMGIAMLIWSARENIRLLRPMADQYLLRLIPAVIGLLAYILVITNRSYNTVLKAAADAKIEMDKGFGGILCVAGLAVYVLSVVFDIVNRKGAV